jgi:hypothetical protein
VGVSATTMFVHTIEMTGKKSGSNRSATAIITIHDTDGNPIAGATVSGVWSGDYAGYVSGVTGTDGDVSFNTGKVRLADAAFTFSVDDVVKTGYAYDSGLNVVTSDTITVP